MKQAIILAMCLVVCGGLAWADIAPDPLITGGATLTAKNAKDLTITMAEEVVDLTPTADRNAVTAVFRLKNTADKPATLEVGFPSWFDEPLQDFAVTVDGEKQLAEVKKEKLSGGPRKTVFKFWMCWPMTFEKNQERTVKVSYWVAMAKQPPGQMGRLMMLPQDVGDKVAVCNSGYVLRTGAAWQGNIGKATIRLHYGQQVKKSLMVSMTPKDGWTYDEKSDIDTLVGESFKPVESRFGGMNAGLPGGAPAKPEQGKNIGDIYYSFKLCDDAQTAQVFEQALKDKKLNAWGMDYLLDMVEKQNVLKLSSEELPKHVMELLEWTVPPQGPQFRQNTGNKEVAYDSSALTPGAELKLHEYYRRVFAYYQQNDHGKALTLGKHFAKFLKTIVDRDGVFINDATKKHWQPQVDQFRKTEQEYKDVSTFVAAGMRQN